MVRRVFEDGAYADRALRAEARDLDARELALATALAYGTIQRRATLDHVAEALAERPVARLDAPVRAAIELGLYQLLFLDGIADHAAVDESVELAKPNRGAGLVNAVLRRAAREGETLLEAMGDETPARAAVRHSHPEWMVRLWWEELGPVETRALLRCDNQPAENALRANTLVGDAEALAAALPVATRPAPGIPEGLVVEEPFDAHASPLWRDGAFMPQSRASMLVARVVDPQPGERVLDLCAAPGGKTTHLAARMGANGEIVAVERHPGRAEALARTCERMHAGNVRVEVADAAGWRPDEPFHRVLVDPPCSGLGTLRSRPDLRWRVSPEAVAELAAEQARILDAAAAAVAPGGTLVYSACTISAVENERQIASFLDRHPGFHPVAPTSDLEEWKHPGQEPYLLVVPHRHGTDGFFIARLRREGNAA